MISCNAQGNNKQIAYNKSAKESAKAFEDAAKAQKNSAKEQRKVSEEQEEVNKKTSKFAILLNRIKTISIYRAIRRGLQIITQSFTQSVDAIAAYNSEFFGTMSKIDAKKNDIII